MVYCYILLCSDNTYYTGITNNIARRFSEHCAGRCSYTSIHKPVAIVYTFEMPNYKHARWLEKRIKKFGAKKYLQIEKLKKQYANILNVM